MNDGRWKLSVYLFVSLILIVTFIKSRTLPTKKRAAFLRYTTGVLLVKVTGVDGAAGVYRIIDDNKPSSAKIMTPGEVFISLPSENITQVHSGNSATQKISNAVTQVFIEKMTATESILLDLPLTPSLMSGDDWQSLPGIGPSLAEEIMRYSQKNGGIGSVEELSAVPGIGEGKIHRIKTFFTPR